MLLLWWYYDIYVSFTARERSVAEEARSFQSSRI